MAPKSAPGGNCVNCHISANGLHIHASGIGLNSLVNRAAPKGPILVVETDDLVRGLLERWLGEAGYLVVGADRLDPASRAAVRLVIANIAAPRRADNPIRSLQALYSAPILAISARFRRGLEGSSEAARRLGVRHVLPKPFTRRQLLAAVRDSMREAA
jgi:DNA-binding response OmpR family regulator